jgi:glucose/arabinose dehydrogenase/PKD repeat protein
MHRTQLTRFLPAILFLVLCGAPLRSQSSSIGLVQHVNKDAGTVTSSSLAFTSNNTAGNWIGVAVRAWPSGATPTVTDTRGNIYRKAVQLNETVDGMVLAIFYAEGIAGGANAVTVSGIPSGGTLRFAILEYSGVATASSLNVTAMAQGTSNAPAASTATPAASGDLVIGVLSTANARTFTAGSGYVIQDRVPAAPNTKLAVEDRILTAAGPVSANGTLNTSDVWGAVLASFRVGAGGGSTAPSITSLNPTSGMVATPVTIAGANFGATPGASTVTFNGTVAAPTSWSATSVVVPVPAGATTGPVVVTVNGVASNGVTFSVTTGADTQTPTAPGNLTATSTAASTVDLNWTASTDNVGVAEYRVEQCQGAGCANFTEIARLGAATTPVAGPLTVSANPNYFQNANGPLILNGSHTWNNLQDWGTNDSLQTLDFNAYVNTLVAHGHNFTYLWYIELPKFCGFPTTAGTPPDFTVGPHPWQRTGPGTATDGALKFDLTKYNQAYFDRLRTRAQALNDAGIYVGVYTFTAEWVGRYRCASDGYPFTGANNINGISDDGSASSFTMSAPNAVTAIQDAYVEKVIDTLNDLPNVLWMVSEEAPDNSTWWNNHQIAHIRAYESTKPNRHPIGYATPADYTTGDAMITNSDADWISPSVRISPATSCGSGTPRCKVNINDSDHSYFGMWNSGAQQNRNFAWQNFTNGNQVAFMDPYVLSYTRENRNLCVSPVNGICSAPDARWSNFRNNLGYILRYSRKLNLANVMPLSTLCSTGACLAQTPSVGAEYLIYAPNGGSFTVNLSAMSSSRTLNVEWFNPSTGLTTVAGSIPAGSASREFTPPFSGDAVLYLVDSAGHLASPAAPAPSYRVTGLTPGTYGYRVRAADGAGNLSSYSNVAGATVTDGSDTTLPSVSLSAPVNGAVVAGTAVTISATASDNVGVVGVQFLVDGAPLGAEDTTAPYSIVWNTTTATSASHALSARARDLAGNTATAAAVNVAVDNQAPTGSVIINGGATATNSRSATLTLAAVDNAQAVAQMRFSNAATGFSAAEAYATTKAWTLTSGAGTKTVYVQFRDTIGNWSASFTDTITLDTAAPTISAVSSSNVTSSSATISWTTNEPATSQIEYGTTTAYGTLTAIDPSLVTLHSVALSGLAPQTTYRYRVRSKDAAGNERLGSNTTFTTLNGSDTAAPSTPAGLAAVVMSPSQINLSWNAATDNVGVTGYLVYRDTSQVATPATTSFQNTGLTPGTTYSYTVAARDGAGNISAQSAPVTAVTPAFAINNVQSSGITSSRATITWATDQAADSQVEYGPTTAYGQLTPLDAALVTSHTQVLIGLNPSSAYHFRVRSRNAAGQLVTSGNFTFATFAAGAFQNEILISGMNLPTALQFLPNGDMLILELGGKIWSVPAGTTQVRPAAFLSLTNIGSLNGQQGLMSMVLDPDFANNRYYYVFYTLGTPNRDRVSRFTATADLMGTVPGTELMLYQDPEDADAEHHGGALNFGNDGKLYITTGEHFDPPNAQSLTNPRGKILRINKDGTIPTDNPFYDGAGPNRDDIWALGLRNPFRAFYDTPSGKFYVADVGGNNYSTAREEVNLAVAGANYGWPTCEGSNCGNPAFTGPVYSYPHNGRDASITGGFIYRGSQFPAQYYGSYFFADYTQNWIRRLTFDASGNVSGEFNFEPPDGAADGPYGDIVYLTGGPDGALYYVDLGFSDTTGQSGISRIRRIRYISDNLPPTAVVSASPTEGAAPLSVTFSSAGSSDPEGQPLAYLWSFGDGTTSTQANPVHTYTQTGQYAVRLTVSDGEIDTTSVPLLVSVGNKPVASILSPADGFPFRGGDTILVNGDATDVEDGVLPASAFTWAVDFLHAGHVHPALPTVGTKSFIFDIPRAGHDFSGETRYRVTLTVTDSDGLQATQSVIIYPDKVNLNFASAPSGLVITIDGLPRTTPFVYDTLVNFQHTIGAANQNLGQTAYTFASWSDGGAQQHTITVPSTAQSYAANFSVSPVQFPPDLVAGYRLDEGTGTTTADISGNNTTGTLVNGPAWTTGKYGNSLSFTGTNFVNLGNPASLRLTGSMTLSAWINISANPWDDGAIVAKLGSAGWQLKTSPDTGARTAAIQISSNGSNSIQRYSATVLTTNTWYHIAGVYDAAARALNIYVNGVLDNGVLSGTVPAAQTDASVNVNIGQRTGMPGDYNFQGRLDEVHIFNRALSASEIQNDMTVPR